MLCLTMEFFAPADFLKEIEDGLQKHQIQWHWTHHQNGIEECGIQTIFGETTHILLMHAGIHWPEAMATALWPMVIKLHNISP